MMGMLGEGSVLYQVPGLSGAALWTETNQFVLTLKMGSDRFLRPMRNGVIGT